MLSDEQINTVRNNSNHTERYWSTFTERQYIKQSLIVSGHFNKVVQLQKCERCSHAHEFKHTFAAVLPFAALNEHLRVHCQAQPKQGSQVSNQTGKRRCVEMDPVWVSAPLLGFADWPHGIDIQQFKEQIKANSEREKKNVGLEVNFQACIVDWGDVIKGLSNQHAYTLKKEKRSLVWTQNNRYIRYFFDSRVEHTSENTEDNLMWKVCCNKNPGDANTYLNDPESHPQKGPQKTKPVGIIHIKKRQDN